VTTAMRLRPAAVARVENVLRAAMTSARGAQPVTGPSGRAPRERRIVRALVRASAPSAPAKEATTARASRKGTVPSAPVAMTTVPVAVLREGMPLRGVVPGAAASRAVLEARPRAEPRRAASRAVVPRAIRAAAVEPTGNTPRHEKLAHQELTPSPSSPALCR
jgi:hypothetical protein